MLESIFIECCMCSHCGPFAASWKEISKDAVFVEGTIGTTDICQGQLGEENLLIVLQLVLQVILTSKS